MSLRGRIVRAVTLVTTVALGGTFAIVSSTFNRQQEKELDAELTAVAREEAREAPALGFSFTSRPGPAANDVGPLTKHGVIFDTQGRVLAATPPFDQSPLTRSSLPARPHTCFDFTWHDQHLRAVLVPIPGHPGRELLLAAPRDDLDGDERFLGRAMLAAFVAALAWTIAVASWAVGRLTRDHERITRVARQVAEGDLSARVASSSTDAETMQLGRDIDAMIGKLDQLLAARDRLVAHAAHELRSPLTRLYGELQQALRKDRDAAGYRQALERALPPARQLTLLVDDLLLLARLRGEQPPDHHRLPLASCVDEAIALVREQADHRHVTLAFTRADVTIDGRERDLVRLIRNVLENAVAHAPEGSTVTLVLTTDDRHVTLEITDLGPGVDDEDRERIFEPFFRSRSSRSPTDRGAGLGLGIARDIARSCGGDVSLLPRTAQTRFRLTLPLPAPAAPG